MFLVSTCPYCRTEKIPFDIKSSHYQGICYDGYNNYCPASQTHFYFNSFSVCRSCNKTVIFQLDYLYDGIPSEDYMQTLCRNAQDILDNPKDATILVEGFSVRGIVTPPLTPSFQCPEHIPPDVKEKFDEATQCHASGCIVASSIMLRLCLETVTKDLLETEADKKQKLYKQIKILSTQGRISPRIQAFATEIRLDGNDAVHEGLMDQENLQDLFDFTIALLEDVYTQPRKIELSQERRAQRKQQGTTS